jgi:hypothetical protein
MKGLNSSLNINLSLTHFPKLKRKLRKLKLRQKGGHEHPAYQECGSDSLCHKNIVTLNEELAAATARQRAINAQFEQVLRKHA